MKRMTTIPAFLAILALAFSLTACDDFFSSGWGNPREYRVENINLTVNNIERWFDRSIGNPPLAARVNEAILLRLEDYLSPEDRRVFQRYGVRIAVSSSNMGVIILSNALDVLANLADFDDMEDEDIEEMLLDILGSIQNDFRNAGGVAAGENIANMIGGDIDTTAAGVPTFNADSFVHEASPSEVAMAIMVLTLAIVEDSQYADSISDWENFDLEALDVGLDINDEGQVIVTGDDTNPKVLVLAAYLNLIKADSGRFEDNFLTGAIRDAFARAED